MLWREEGWKSIGERQNTCVWMRGRITVVAQWKCKEKRWRKWRISNTWAQLYKVMEGREVKKRVQAGWNGWRRMSGVICDRRVPARVKGKVYKVAVRPAMLYGLEIVALTKRQEAEMEVAELKMLRFSLGVTRMDKIRNEYIRGTAQVGKFGEKTREARLRWYGHLRRKDDGYIGRRMLRMELPGKRKRGRPKRRFMDVVKEDMAEVEVTEEDTVDRRNWRKKIRCGDPWWEKPKEEEEVNLVHAFLCTVCNAISYTT